RLHLPLLTSVPTRRSSDLLIETDTRDNRVHFFEVPSSSERATHMITAKLLVERGSIHDASQDWGDYNFVALPSPGDRIAAHYNRSEEHTSELQSRANLVCR